VRAMTTRRACSLGGSLAGTVVFFASAALAGQRLPKIGCLTPASNEVFGAVYKPRACELQAQRNNPVALVDLAHLSRLRWSAWDRPQRRRRATSPIAEPAA
jgi:hypothetical protein